MQGAGRGAELDILSPNSEVMERACQVGTVALDKTVTLARGRSTVTNFFWRMAHAGRRMSF